MYIALFPTNPQQDQMRSKGRMILKDPSPESVDLKDAIGNLDVRARSGRIRFSVKAVKVTGSGSRSSA